MIATAALDVPESALPRLPWGRLAAGLPALLVAPALLAALLLKVDPPLAGRYDAEGERRVVQGDLAGALVCFQRLVALEPDRPDARYALVLVLEHLGRRDEAAALARGIAPAVRSGYPPAHFWMARYLLADHSRLAERASAIEGHLLRYLQAEPGSTEAQALLGGVYAATGRPAKALPYLEKSAGTNPERLLELARVLKALDQREVAVARARVAIEGAQRRAQARPDDTRARVTWARACVVLEDYPEALAVLDGGRALSGDPGFARTMAEVCSAWAEAAGRKPGADAGERLKILDRGLHYDPGNHALLEQVATLLQGTSDDTAAGEQARGLLRAALAQGAAPALAHLLLGNDAWARNEREAARIHWEQAHQLDPAMPLVVNNLAWSLAFVAPTDPPRALALIDQALVIAPGQPRLHATRGLILARLERWKDALAALETALAGGENNADVHAALAAAYEHLGVPAMAAEHRKPGGPGTGQ
jgi:tetratricopeptide (TPR) repeat protein